MGDWHISVQGTGSHHNQDLPDDADRMAIDFVNNLKLAGHRIERATFTYGGRQDISPSESKEE